MKSRRTEPGAPARGKHVLMIPFDIYTPKACPYVGIFIYHQARALKTAGFKVGVIALELRPILPWGNRRLGGPAGIEFEDDEGIPVYRYRGRSWIPLIMQAKIRLTLRAGMMLFRRYVRNHGMPDIVHAHNALYGGLIASRIKKAFGIPYAITEHSSAYGREQISKKQMPWVDEAFSRADARMAVSHSLGTILEGLLNDRFRDWNGVPNLLDKMFEDQALPERDQRSGDGRFTFLTIGLYSDVKGQADLLRAFALQYEGRDDVQLRMGGGGPLRNDLEKMARELGIKKYVVFLGDLERDQVLREMQHCDAYVLPSHYETFGVVLLEALSCGKPVIATACGGPEEIVNKKNGLLVPRRDPTALGHAMETMRSNIDGYDRAWIRKDCISRFGEEAFVKKISGIYAGILNENRSK
jgi:glycosyltransferase involved in cell wall biosynthesis